MKEVANIGVNGATNSVVNEIGIGVVNYVHSG